LKGLPIELLLEHLNNIFSENDSRFLTGKQIKRITVSDNSHAIV
jgi:hypothetical protein